MYAQTDSKQQIQAASASKRALIGGLIGLTLVMLFLMDVGFKGRPEWHHTWFVRPIAVEILAGAFGGAISAWLDQLAIRMRWSRIAVAVLSFLIFFIGLWMGFVLGFVGTYWH